MQFIIASILWIAVEITSVPQQFDWLGDRHIIGGSNAKGDDKLYQVSLEKDGKHFCGGAVVSEQHIVTAAHCLKGEDYRKITVRAGSLKRNKGLPYDLEPLSVNIMGCYNENNHDCDIAVFKVKKKFSSGVLRSIVSLTNKEPPAETFLTVTGWGLTGAASSTLPDELQEARIKIVKRPLCRALYHGINYITDNMICAGDEQRNICKGDSGGPLVDDEERPKRLVGIVAWGVQESANISCSPKYHGVFTSVGSSKVQKFLRDALDLL